MLNNRYIKHAVLAVGILCFGFSGAQAQTAGLPPTDTLYRQILQMDSILFSGINDKKPENMAAVFDSTLEFYHDKGGLSDYKWNIENLKNFPPKNSDLKRELIEGSTEIHPIPGYGAIQVGRHRFTHTEHGKPSIGVFKFLHIWKRKDGKWKLTRIVSYDHS